MVTDPGFALIIFRTSSHARTQTLKLLNHHYADVFSFANFLLIRIVEELLNGSCVSFLGQRALESADNPKYAAKPHFNTCYYGIVTKGPTQIWLSPQQTNQRARSH